MRSAFTLIEVLLVIALASALVVVSIPIMTSLQTFSAVAAVHGPLLGDLRLAALRAATGYGARGMYLEVSRYTIYVGNAYATRDPSRDVVVALDSGVTMELREFAGGSGPLDLRFAAGTGAPSDTGTIAVRHTTGRTEFLAIRPSGLIEEVRSGTVVLAAEGDATLSASAPSVNAGATTQLEAYPWQPSNTRRSVLRFSLSAVPRGATVSGARLTLQATQTYGASRTIALHRVTKPWDEGAVTWQHTGAQFWDAAGGDFTAMPSASATLTWSGSLPLATFTVTADVQRIVDGTAENNGWLLKDASEDSSQAYWFFSSREGETAPRLEVDYAF
ncbi:MAG: DNRLRE domain-containing protein [bacterium]|nr:DNRLRE domain-containing protein [bacterium]